MMDKKNTVLLTVIAVATLLVAVVGATFAYFSISQTNTNASSVVTATTKGAPGVISLEGGNTTLAINLNDADMKQAKQGTTYYATATGATSGVTTDPGYANLGTIGITAGDSNSNYGCTWTFDISMVAKTTNGATDTDNNGVIDESEKVAIPASSFKDADGVVTLTSGSNIELSETSFKLSELMAGTKTVNVKFVQTGNGSNDYEVKATFVNTTVEQDELSNMSATITFSAADSLTCDTYETLADAKTAVGFGA